MESEQEIHSTFSTLNVNAVEFVPNFGAPPVKDPETMIEENAKPAVETTENNGNGKSSAKTIDVSVNEGKIATSNDGEMNISSNDLIPFFVISQFHLCFLITSQLHQWQPLRMSH